MDVVNMTANTVQIQQSCRKPPENIFFQKPLNQKSQGARSNDRGGQAVGKDRLITHASVNACLNNSWTNLAMRVGAPSCINMVLIRNLVAGDNILYDGGVDSFVLFQPSCPDFSNFSIKPLKAHSDIDSRR
ncbi:hypothetical protein TNCV_4830371 [Trichonephila clavipes]|nr:hypothetical protein TNCV_4830371 [Trichonephila clavipes]